MILMHAGITWWSQGRRWGSGNVVECCQAQAVPPKCWRLQCGSRNREGKQGGSRTSTAQNPKITAGSRLRPNDTGSDVIVTQSQGGSAKPRLSSGPFPVLWVFQQHIFLEFSSAAEQITLVNRFVTTLEAEGPASIPQTDPSQHRRVWPQPNSWEGRTNYSESSLKKKKPVQTHKPSSLLSECCRIGLPRCEGQALPENKFRSGASFARVVLIS